MTVQGVIVKALSGFYYVQTAESVITCRARGKFRMDGSSPLVGDRVEVEPSGDGTGSVRSILPRRNFFIRPAVANIDVMIIMAANVNPVTDPFLIDRASAFAEHADCECIICINKCDLDPGDALYDIYSRTGYTVLRTSAVTGEGVDGLRRAISGKTAAFSGNSGVGKSSLLNCLGPGCRAQVGEVSERLGRGRHTTRHVELFNVGGSCIADTPGFASFDLAQMDPIKKDELQYCFPEFRQCIGSCRFDDCRHIREPGCAVLEAVRDGKIPKSRHDSYTRLYDVVSRFREWEQK